MRREIRTQTHRHTNTQAQSPCLHLGLAVERRVVARTTREINPAANSLRCMVLPGKVGGRENELAPFSCAQDSRTLEAIRTRTNKSNVTTSTTNNTNNTSNSNNRTSAQSHTGLDFAHFVRWLCVVSAIPKRKVDPQVCVRFS